MIKNSNVFVTGGAGSWGYALAKRRKKEGWTGRLTVYSTDSHKHELMRREFQDINFIQGDIRNPETLYNAMVGHDIVFHMAAVKIIPVSEVFCLDTYDVNVNGSQNVCRCAIDAKVKHVVGISTDKACKPVNTYGATKMLMERLFQEYARNYECPEFHLLRAGNVIATNGSVIEAWRKAKELGEPIKITDPEMTRFWLSPDQAILFILKSLSLESGTILIPEIKSLSIGTLASYVVGEDYPTDTTDIRPGEKVHETLMTVEESHYVDEMIDWDDTQNSCFILYPNTLPKRNTMKFYQSYSSDNAQRLTKEEFEAMLTDG